MRAQIFLCILAYYVEWRLCEAWRELLFAGPHLDEINQVQDPAFPTKRSSKTKLKAAGGQLDNGSAVYCFRTLMEQLESIKANTYQPKGSGDEVVEFQLTSLPNDKQQRAMAILKSISFPDKRSKL